MARLVKVGDSYFNPEYVAVVSRRAGGFGASIEMHSGTRFPIDNLTAREVAETLERGSMDIAEGEF